VQGTDTETLKQDLDQARRRVEQLEQALVRAQRLATVGQLASRMAHEFNNLLTLMIGRAEQALKYDEPELTEKALKMTIASGHRTAEIIRGLLGYATGRQTQSERVPADTLMESAAALIAWDLPKDGIQLVRRYETQARVRIVPGRIEQVLLNLILNARKAMAGRGGTLTLAVAPADVDGYVGLQVGDTGCGIPPENIEKIFDPFFTAPTGNGNGGESNGTGLGLTVARDLVRQAGGEIRAASTPGASTTFTVLLPIANENASA
jgi:two-component system cell cycle sensor histidine kinase/response regulator CckA